jgi:hypothetical protein
MTESNNKYSEEMLNEAHKHSFGNKDEILKSEVCGCFYCFKTYPPSEIKDEYFIPESKEGGKSTLWCAKCGIDSVIGSASGFPVSENEFLRAMNDNWFNGYSNDY